MTGDAITAGAPVDPAHLDTGVQGLLCIGGTRVTIHPIAAMSRDGMTVEAIARERVDTELAAEAALYNQLA